MDKVNNPTHLKDLKDVYLGAEVAIALKSTHKLAEDSEIYFTEHFDFDNDFLKCLAPDDVLKGNVKSISELYNFIPNIVDLDRIQDIGTNNVNYCIMILEERSIESFW